MLWAWPVVGVHDLHESFLSVAPEPVHQIAPPSPNNFRGHICMPRAHSFYQYDPLEYHPQYGQCGRALVCQPFAGKLHTSALGYAWTAVVVQPSLQNLFFVPLIATTSTFTATLGNYLTNFFVENELATLQTFFL